MKQLFLFALLAAFCLPAGANKDSNRVGSKH